MPVSARFFAPSERTSFKVSIDINSELAARAPSMTMLAASMAGQAALPLHESLMTGATDVEEAADRALTQRRLAAALSHLTEDQRQVILFKFVQGMSN